jgi:DNA-binding transcriptional MerR regulator
LRKRAPQAETFSHQETAKLARLRPRELIYLAERSVVPPSLQDARGRGSVRRYSSDDVAALKLAKLLRDRGYECKTVGEIIALVRAFLDELRSIPGHEWAPACLSEVEPSKPVWLHVVDGTFAAIETERGLGPYAHLPANRNRPVVKNDTKELIEQATDRLVINLAKVVNA